MDREQRPKTKVGAQHIGLERLRERIERLLLSSDVPYGVGFDNEGAGGEFAYSWAAIWSENRALVITDSAFSPSSPLTPE